jgi:hypothetical protein
VLKKIDAPALTLDILLAKAATALCHNRRCRLVFNYSSNGRVVMSASQIARRFLQVSLAPGLLIYVRHFVRTVRSGNEATITNNWRNGVALVTAIASEWPAAAARSMGE